MEEEEQSSETERLHTYNMLYVSDPVIHVEASAGGD